MNEESRPPGRLLDDHTALSIPPEAALKRFPDRLELVDEDAWFASLNDLEQARIIRELNAVDRAADAGRRARQAA